MKGSGSPCHTPVPICRLGDGPRPTHYEPGKGQLGGQRVKQGTDATGSNPKTKA